MKIRRRFQKTGWALVALGLAILMGFWGYLVPAWEAMVPDYYPHLSPQGFWKVKERALKLGTSNYEVGLLAGTFGGREWADIIIGRLRKGQEFGERVERQSDTALMHITNHAVAADEGYAAEWLAWWEVNRGRTQEEWIQHGFAEIKFDIALLPVKEDWPKLLGVLGASAGPSQRRHRVVEPIYPDHVRYNAYRWLRDSGFEPVEFMLSEEGQNLSLEKQAGLLEYRAWETILSTPPPPGTLAFAPKNKWGWAGRGPEDKPVNLRLMPQALVTGVCLVMVLGGLALVGLRVRVSFVRASGEGFGKISGAES